MDNHRPWTDHYDDDPSYLSQLKQELAYFLVAYIEGQAVAVGEAGPVEPLRPNGFRGHIKRWPRQDCIDRCIQFGAWEGGCGEETIDPAECPYDLVRKDCFDGLLIDELKDPGLFLDKLDRQLFTPLGIAHNTNARAIGATLLL